MRHLTHAIPLLLAAAAASAATSSTISRLTDAEISAGVQLDVAELAAHVASDGTASLLLGTSSHGTVRVSDPYAVRFAPRRLLQPGEYAVRFDTGRYLDDGTIVLAENVGGSATVTNNLVIEAVAPGVSIASVACDIDQQGTIAGRWTETDSAWSRRFLSSTGQLGGIGPLGYCRVSNIRVWVWTSDMRTAVWNSVTEHVTLADTLGTVPVSGLRQWVCDRYDGRTGEDWSRFPATNRVSLAGQPVRFNASGTLALRHDGASSTNAMRVLAYGSPVLSIVPGIGPIGGGDLLRIVDMVIGSSTATLYCNTDLGAPVTIQTIPALGGDDWLDVPEQTGTYPETETRTIDGLATPCYAVTVPIDPAATSAFFRATSSASGETTAELRIDNCALYLAGRRVTPETWTFGLTNGTSVTRTVLILED